MSRIAQVILKQNSRYIDREFDYLVGADIHVGDQVLVPFGRGNIPYEGVVTNIFEGGEETGPLKKAIRIVGDFSVSRKRLELAQWMRSEYLCSYYDAIALMLPRKEDVAEVYEWVLCSSLTKLEIRDLLLREKSNAKNKRLLLQQLLEGEVNITELQREIKKSLLPTARSLEKNKIAWLEKRRINRVPKMNYHIPYRNVQLSQLQEKVMKNIIRNVDSGKNTLLHGITGSGKTEIYIHLIQHCLQKQKQAIILVPEISLTPQTIARFKNVFGDRIGVFHSQISAGERNDQLELIGQGKVDIVIGARSALFVPFENLGLIIMDECHDDAYKSDISPKYDGVDVAAKLCRLYGAGLVLGSATPTIEQYYDATVGKYDLQELLQREIGALPQIKIIDTRTEMKIHPNMLISNEIMEAIQNEINQNKQVIIFLNKRGYATTLSCHLCGHTIICPNCDISLTYHRQGNKLMCHYCGYEEAVKTSCSNCDDGQYQIVGYGTQRIEEIVQNKIVGASILRLDRDTTRQKGDHERLLQMFKNGEKNIMIGTQMISKGLDFKEVNLVVILNADQGLRFPDYRSVEKTFSTILQVAGRGGRSDDVSQVLLQTNDVENPIFKQIQNQDYSSFYWEELKERKLFNYPPFSKLLRIVCSSEELHNAADTAEKTKNGIEYYFKKRNRNIVTLGPVPNLIHKIDKKFRWQLFYKIENEEEFQLLKRIIGFILSEKRSIIVSKNTAVSVEINPKSLI